MNLRRSMLSVGGIGFIPAAPGTFASLVPIALVALSLAIHLHTDVINIILVALIIASSAICILFTSSEEKSSGKTDPSWIVADEVAGQSLALLLPWEGVFQNQHSAFTPWLILASAFGFFRLLDITKPPPIRQSQSLPHGWGVLIDDLLAGTLALVVLQLACRLWLTA